MKMRKKTFKIYAAWDFEAEEMLYNEMSKEGWQAVKAGCFYQEYVWDDSVVYRYQMDYNSKIKDKTRYIEMFEEQGWEYLNSTFNGWHCFRKAYREELPEEEYQIYTDETSVKEMRDRWTRLAGGMMLALGLACLLQLVHLITQPSLVKAVLFAAYAYIAAFLAFGYLRMKGIWKRKSRRRSLFGIYLAICFLLGVCSGFLLGERVELYTAWNAEAGEFSSGGVIDSFEVKYRDYYYLTLKLNSDVPVSFLISNEEGQEIYRLEAEQVEEKQQLKLEKGNYDITVLTEAEYESDACIELEYEID